MKRSLVTPRRRVEEIQRVALPRTVFKAYLAEQYDGIGQYVLVALAKSSSSAGYKVRIASGDFNTGQLMPAGTPVSVFAYRGKMEVISMGAK